MDLVCFKSETRGNSELLLEEQCGVLAPGPKAGEKSSAFSGVASEAKPFLQRDCEVHKEKNQSLNSPVRK